MTFVTKSLRLSILYLRCRMARVYGTAVILTDPFN